MTAVHVPTSVAAFLDALSHGGPADASDSLAPGAILAFLPEGEETSPRAVVSTTASREALVAAGARVGGAREVLVAVLDGDRVLVEGLTTWAGQSTPGTFMASFRLDAAGRISRFVEFGCREQVRFAPSAGGRAASAVAPELVDRYFHALDSGAFPEAAACFSDGTLYSHPPYKNTGITDPNRVQFDGRPALLEAFGHRGAQTFGHEIIAMAHNGEHCLFEGRVFDLPDDRVGGFVSSLTLDADGLMERYVSFYAEPAVPLS